MAVAAKAVCLALARHPGLNSRWDEDAGEIVEHHYVNLGIAAATGRGLVVPEHPRRRGADPRRARRRDPRARRDRARRARRRPPR